MAASDDNFISETFLNGCFSKTAAKIILRYTVLHFFTVTSCLRGMNFYQFLSGKDFPEKCKHSELALNFIQKQYFSPRKPFPFIIVE